MNYNPNPRTEFLKDTEADNQLRAHMIVAMAEMQRRFSMNTEPNNFNLCASAHLQMLGAQVFMDIFLNLAETAVAETRKDTGNLPSNVTTLPRKN